MAIPTANVGFIDQMFTERLGDQYAYGGVFAPDPNTQQSTDCSGLVGWVLEGYVNGPENMSWGRVVTTESWGYDYGTNTPAAPGTIGPYGTIAIASPNDIPADAALLITIMHGGGGEYSHVACSTGPAITPTPLAAPAGKIMESNGSFGVCTNGTGGTSEYDPEWTDFWYLAGPIAGDYTPPPPPPPGRFYTVQSGDSFSVIALRLGVSMRALAAANPSIANPNLIYPGQVLQVP